ncbi:unnamed protein product, partial [Mesorhabditis belari]|uniref:Succinate dehydrogenase assembly factor 2, mitochondrial n=1 Tax=Mesorhabditis belari TaxID=2138241 RepID=A0AAF3F2L1_9BILA
MLIKPVCTRFFAAIAGTSRYFSVVRSMSQVNSEISGIDKTRARLLYQSKKRGILENDIILGGFAEENLAQMNEQQLKSYDELINGEHMEWDLYYYLSGKKTPPKEIMVDLNGVYETIDKERDEWIRILKESVAIESVSADPARRGEVRRMVEWTMSYLLQQGAECWLEELGQQTLHDGTKVPLPPCLLGELGKDKNKKTVLLYGHLDVQPARKEDGWNTEPFEVVESDGKLWGRGTSDDKGPVLSWIHAIKVLNQHKIEIPVNIKFCFEAMEESGSEGLKELLERKKADGWLDDVEYTCISDSYWLGTEKPCLSYGLRGICSFHVEVGGLQQDLHSGVYGGSVYEPLNDLFYLMSQLMDVNGKILIPGIMDQVANVTDLEKDAYQKIDFDVKEYRESVGAAKLPEEQKEPLLMNRWRYPSLSVHGVEGAFSDPGDKTVIPAKVIGKFSIRVVPDMQPEKINECVAKYLNDLWAKRGSGNTLKVHVQQGSVPWVHPIDHPHFQAASRAVKRVYGVDPDFIREGCSIPITLTFQELTGHSVILLPTNASDAMAHSQNEKMRTNCYIDGIKLLATYLMELGY